MKRLILFTFLFLEMIFLQGQNNITANVKDEFDNVLEGAVAIIKIKATETILSYGITDKQGNLSIKLDTNEKKLTIEVSFLGYDKWIQNIENKSNFFDISLNESAEELKEVVLTASDIEKRGDTLNYSVRSFKSQQDRSIADVIKKMPGINILPSGQITYLGDPIEKYYIEGLDLLEGRYSLANENISADDVLKVQILENHQPIKILDSLVVSNKTSLNLKLKKNTTTTGTVETGIGVNPLLIEANITPLIFTKKSQLLTSYQYNNTGQDLNKNNQNFSSENGGLNYLFVRDYYTSIIEPFRPSFKSNRWLNNRDHFGNFSYLNRFKKNTDIKINLSYSDGIQFENGDANTTILVNSDTIKYSEKIDNKINLKKLKSKITLEGNNPGGYFKNTLSIDRYWTNQLGNLEFNQSNIQQEIVNPFLGLANSFVLIKPINKQLITFKTLVGYSRTEENFVVNPGQFEELLNSGQSYSLNKQFVESPIFFAKSTIELTKKVKNLSISPEIGVTHKREKLFSNQSIVFEESEVLLGDNFLNDLEFTNTNLFLSNTLELNKNKWSIVLNSPLFFRNFIAEDNATGILKSFNRVNFQPELLITNKISPYLELSIQGKKENKFGQINNLFGGLILNNYLNLVKYNSTFLESNNILTTTNFKYRDPLNALFSSISYTLATGKNNILNSNSISNNGTRIVENVLLDNDFNSHQFNFNLSKFFNKLKTTISTNAVYGISNRDILINNDIVNFSSSNQLYHLTIDSQISKWLNIGLNSDLSFSMVNFSSKQSTKVKSWNNSLNAFFYLSKSDFFNVKTEHYYNNFQTNSINNFFLDFSYQFSIKKLNMDTEIIWNNVLNTKEYSSITNDLFSINEYNYIIRPSQVIIRCKFSL